MEYWIFIFVNLVTLDADENSADQSSNQDSSSKTPAVKIECAEERKKENSLGKFLFSKGILNFQTCFSDFWNQNVLYKNKN